VRTIALVPARLGSTRLEKKLLRLISNTPLVVSTAKHLLKSKLEKAELIEAMRFFENGIKIKILELKNNYIGIEDLIKARKTFND
tara:strand:- start:268 stop:522 length:255 start_codon:yes stop_codon:yes gene_type:complete